MVRKLLEVERFCDVTEFAIQLSRTPAIVVSFQKALFLAKGAPGTLCWSRFIDVTLHHQC